MSKIKLQRLNDDKKITVCFDGKAIVLPINLQRKIEENWRKLLASGKKYFNGEVFSIKDIKKSGAKITITVRKTNFAHYLYNRKVDSNLGKYNLRTAFASCLLLTKDNKIIFGKMGAHTSLAGRYQLIGGGLNNDDLNGDVFDIKHSVIREVNEELGINLNDKNLVKNFMSVYLKTGGNGNVAVIYKALLNKSAEEILADYEKFVKKLKKVKELPEFSKIVFLSLNKKKVEKFISENKKIMAEYLPLVLRDVVLES